MDRQVLLEKFLHRQLTDNEARELEALMQSDADFAEEVAVATALNADHNVRQKQEWKAMLAEQRAAAPQALPRSGRRIWLNVARLAAAVAVLIAAFFLFYPAQPSPQQLAANYLKTPHLAPEVTRNQNVDPASWNDIRTAYLDEDYRELIRLLRDDIQAGNGTPQHTFYLGLGYLYQPEPDYEQAITALRSLIDRSASFQEEAQWFLALAYLRNDQPEQAESLLRTIVDRQQWRSEEAAKLLGAMG